MALVILITAILISALVVKVGTVALTMTGLDRSKAAFQAKSAFTNTGWTTREAELIMAHDQRRRIVGAMMAPGYAGFASVIATLMTSIGQRGVIEFLRSLAILAVAAPFIYLLARLSLVLHNIRSRRRISNRARVVRLPAGAPHAIAEAGQPRYKRRAHSRQAR
jgi:hypothetical protein